MTNLDAQMQQLDGLLQEIENSSDARAKNASRAVVALLLDLHKDGLTRLLDVVDGAADACANDPLLNSLLLLHDLHPTPLLERARSALAKCQGVRAVDVVANEGGLVVVVVVDTVEGVSPGALVSAAEDALVAAVPDAAAVRFTGSAAASAAGLVTLSRKRAS